MKSKLVASCVHHPAVRPRRLFVSGGSELSANAARLWEELGALLAKEKGLVVITGGLKERTDSPGTTTADCAVVKGMLSTLKRRRVSAANHIETVLPERRFDASKHLRRFRKGRVQVLPNRTAQSRRFSMVNSADVVISIEGAKGTRSVLDMALAIEKPILPLPFFGKLDLPENRDPPENLVSLRCWKEHLKEIRERFDIRAFKAAEWRKTKLDDLSQSQIRSLAREIRDHLLAGFTRNCFVIMPFRRRFGPVYEKAIKPALVAHGMMPLRTDRLGLTGNVVEFIRAALGSCYFAIADTTHDRPNVMYELGMAHAENKPVILLRSAKARPAPFDIQNQNIIHYTRDMKALRVHLERTIAVVLGKAESIEAAGR